MPPILSIFVSICLLLSSSTENTQVFDSLDASGFLLIPLSQSLLSELLFAVDNGIMSLSLKHDKAINVSTLLFLSFTTFEIVRDQRKSFCVFNSSWILFLTGKGFS